MSRFRECCFKTFPTKGRRLVWEITHTCQFNCDYCFQARKRQNNPMRVLNNTDLIEICKRLNALAVNDVLISGGEIFYAKDAIGPICEILKDLKVTLSFSTAQLFNKDFVNHLFSFHPRAINISLDPREISETKSAWDHSLGGAKYILQMGDLHDKVSVKITGVVNSNNIINFGDYLNVMKDLCLHHKCLSAVYITNPYDIGYVKANVRATDEDLNKLIKALKINQLPEALKMVNFPRQNAPLQHCLAGSSYLHIEPNGNVYPCHLFANYNEEVFLMGNILHDDVKEISSRLDSFGKQAITAINKYKTENKICQQCKNKKTCGGGCLAEVISVGQLVEPQLICKYITPPRPRPSKIFAPLKQRALKFEYDKDLTEEEEQLISSHIQSNLRSQKHDLAHGFDHTKCVVNLSRFIATKEKANLRIVSAAAYFHDFAPRQELIFESHTRISAEKAVSFLKSINFSEQDISEIYRCIDTSSYGSNQLGKYPESLESKIIRDADWLDAIGARGIARVFAFASAHGCEVLGEVEWDPDNPPRKRMSLVGPDPSPIYHFFSKLLWVKEKMQTKTGAILAEERHKRLVEFLRNYKDEISITQPDS